MMYTSSRFFCLRKSKSPRGQYAPYAIGNKNPRNKNATIIEIRASAVCVSFFWPIFDGVPRFGPSQDPNKTIEKIFKKC